jgi:hypothetical protein
MIDFFYKGGHPLPLERNSGSALVSDPGNFHRGGVGVGLPLLHLYLFVFI